MWVAFFDSFQMARNVGISLISGIGLVFYGAILYFFRIYLHRELNYDRVDKPITLSIWLPFAIFLLTHVVYGSLVLLAKGAVLIFIALRLYSLKGNFLHKPIAICLGLMALQSTVLSIFLYYPLVLNALSLPSKIPLLIRYDEFVKGLALTNDTIFSAFYFLMSLLFLRLGRKNDPEQ